MTGAPLPPVTDTAVPRGQVAVVNARHILLALVVAPHRHIRRRGSDLAAGALLARAGTCIDATLAALMAASGVADVALFARPHVAIVSTGNELSGDPAGTLAPGQIRDANGPFWHLALAEAGAQVVAWSRIGDDPQRFTELLDEQRGQADLVLTMGGISASVRDYVSAVLERAGAHFLFGQVAIRPGKPILAATLPGGPCLLGLPGNPVAAAVGLRFVAMPLLRYWQGPAAEAPLAAVVQEGTSLKAGLRHFLKARVEAPDDGPLRIRLLPGQESYRLATLHEANAWAVIDPASPGVETGAWVAIHPREVNGRWCFA